MRREPSTSDLLAAWEAGLVRSPLERPLAILAAGTETEPPERLAELPVGRRDCELLSLRRALFGPQLESLTPCPSCGEQLELTVNVDELTVAADADPAETYTATADGCNVSFRLPTTADLLSVHGGDLAAARLLLLERCVVAAEAAGEGVAPADLPDAVVATVSERMREADPQAEIELDLHCPGCAHRWREPLDIGSFLWAELDVWARRLLQDVAVLATAYGWTESDVVALSPMRRQAYLELAGA
jgi:hypothetical protein